MRVRRRAAYTSFPLSTEPDEGSELLLAVEFGDDGESVVDEGNLPC